MQRVLTIKLFEKAVKNKVARQDSRHSPEESRDAMHPYSLKLAQLRWTGHVIRMPDERLSKKVFNGELQEGKRSQCDQKKSYKDTLKTSLKGFQHTYRVLGTDSTRAIKVAESPGRSLINKGATLYL